MRSIIVSSIFLLFLLASTVRAQDPTAIIAGTIPTGTIPPTNTMTPTSVWSRCVPRIASGMPQDLLTWEPRNKTIFLPGEKITFWINPMYYITAWIVNGREFPVVVPTSTPLPATSTPPSAPYPAPNPTSTPIVPTPTSAAYPAPDQALAVASLDDCIVPNRQCLAVVMPDSCQLIVEARGPGLIPRNVSSENILVPVNSTPIVAVNITPVAPLDSAPTLEPISPGPSTQISHPTEPISVPEPLTLLLFGIGATGIVGYAMRHR
ncbi:PEP-CTERM sorting domain-containing protein [Chloroflexi bacterium TSY]|nr:PEP-CTERM sorting domain-containing protein [Chloroflexi bacterium TSY]